VFWWIVLAVAVVLFALAWWSSGRTRRGVDADALRRSHGKMQGEVGQHSLPPPTPGIPLGS
jgi:hypothetical protein